MNVSEKKTSDISQKVSFAVQADPLQSLTESVNEVKALLLQLIDTIEDHQDSDAEEEHTKSVIQSESGPSSQVRQQRISGVSDSLFGKDSSCIQPPVAGLHSRREQCSRFSNIQFVRSQGNPNCLSNSNQCGGEHKVADQVMETGLRVS